MREDRVREVKEEGSLVHRGLTLTCLVGLTLIFCMVTPLLANLSTIWSSLGNSRANEEPALWYRAVLPRRLQYNTLYCTIHCVLRVLRVLCLLWYQAVLPKVTLCNTLYNVCTACDV